MHLLEALNLMDIQSTPLAPTSRNGHRGEEVVYKWLDRFLMVENLLEGCGEFWY